MLPRPTDALIELKVWCRLCCIVPVRLHIDTSASLPRIAPARVPQRRPACRRVARWLRLHPDVVQYLTDVGAVRDEGDDAHLPATKWAQQREHLVDAGDQRRS